MKLLKFIETKYDKLTTIKNKLCGMLKVYNLLNLECTLLKSKIDHYMITLSIEEDKKKKIQWIKRPLKKQKKL